jgi:hypothetical protein
VKFVSTEGKLEESTLFLKFFFDKYSGLHTIAKYDIEIWYFLVNFIDGRDSPLTILVVFFATSYTAFTVRSAVRVPLSSVKVRLVSVDIGPSCCVLCSVFDYWLFSCRDKENSILSYQVIPVDNIHPSPRLPFFLFVNIRIHILRSRVSRINKGHVQNIENISEFVSVRIYGIPGCSR